MDALVSTEWLAGELESEDLRLFDVTVFLGRDPDGTPTVESGRAKWVEEHIPGSGFLDILDELSDTDAPHRFTAPRPDALAQSLAARGVGSGTRVVLYDRSNTMWATRVWWLMRSIGFDDVAVLDGGWRAWNYDGRATSSEPEPHRVAATLAAVPRPEMIVGSGDVEAAISDDSTCIINSLSADNHEGRDSSYGQPGHIPGAGNVFAVSLLDPETHRYRPLDELDEMFAAAGATDGPIITYCGGGIAATSDAFILSLLGHQEVAVYDGSLREWIDKGLPLEV